MRTVDGDGLALAPGEPEAWLAAEPEEFGAATNDPPCLCEPQPLAPAASRAATITAPIRFTTISAAHADPPGKTAVGGSGLCGSAGSRPPARAVAVDRARGGRNAPVMRRCSVPGGAPAGPPAAHAAQR